MATMDIEFEQSRAFTYELADTPDGKVIRQTSARTESFFPLAIHPNVSLLFGDLDGKPEGFLRFAHEWGFLREFPGKGKQEAVATWHAAWKSNRFWIKAYARGVLVRPEGSNAIMRTRVTGVDVWVASRGAGDNRPRLLLRPPNLEEAMRLQLAQAVSTGRSILACEHCGKWFEAGGGAKRVVSRFCSIAHRNQFNYQKNRGSK